MNTTIEKDIRCNAIVNLWSCDTLEKAQQFLNTTNSKSHVTLENFISNDFLPPVSEDWIESYEPKTGRILSRVPNSSPEDVQKAVVAATEAFVGWSKTSRAERSRYMQRIAALIQQNRELFAVWESIDQGKTVERARIEIDRAISNFS
jgi:acyl-CoA reductase-like NAD-dependent aldehyde dehydrogenase